MEVTWNPNDAQGKFSLSNGNLTVELRGSVPRSIIRATEGKSEGKWYWEIKLGDTSGSHINNRTAALIGIMDESVYPHEASTYNNLKGYYTHGNSSKHPEKIPYGEGGFIGDIISVLLNLDQGNLEFWRNGKSLGISHADLFEEEGKKFPALTSGLGNSSAGFITMTANFGATPFQYKIPDGYKPYNHSEDTKIKIITMKL